MLSSTLSVLVLGTMVESGHKNMASYHEALRCIQTGPMVSIRIYMSDL
jgi:hypothetical protein